jgi:hypothetical protein
LKKTVRVVAVAEPEKATQLVGLPLEATPRRWSTWPLL